MKRTNEKKYEFKCSKCGELKEKIVSQKLIKQFKQNFGYDIKKLGLINLSITCDDCIEIIVKEKKCKLCGDPLKNYLDVFCSSKCHKTYLKKKDRLSLSEEIKIDNKNKNVEDFVETYAPFGYYFIKCGCGVFATDYPFIGECRRCGYKYAGSKEEIKRAKMEGNYMTILKPSEVPIEKRKALIEEYEKDVYVFYPKY